MEVSAEWILGSFVALAGIIGSLAKLIYKGSQTQIQQQNRIIDALRADIVRLSMAVTSPVGFMRLAIEIEEED